MGVVRLLAVSAVLMLALVPSPAAAQYFGRNKVEYMDFDFKVLASEHFDVYYYPREEAAARLAVQLAVQQGPMLTHVLSAVFFAAALVFIWRSFYGMRIAAEAGAK